MRNIIYKDRDISQSDYHKLLDEYSKFILEHTGIKTSFITEEYDFSNYPTILDSDGDDVLRPAFLQDISDKVTSKYGKYGTDNIITLIHQDNWKSGRTSKRKGIWGTNYSYKHGTFHIQYCRFDTKNPANSFGTLNHEIDHSFDVLIKVETNVDINKILGISNYDTETTHGGNPKYKYIRYQENASKLKLIAPYLREAYKARLDRSNESLMKKQIFLIELLNKALYLLRMKLNIKK